MPPCSGPDSAASPASAAAASEAPVEAATRAAKVEALSSWSASSTRAHADQLRAAPRRNAQAAASRAWIGPSAPPRPRPPATASAKASSRPAASAARARLARGPAPAASSAARPASRAKARRAGRGRVRDGRPACGPCTPHHRRRAAAAPRCSRVSVLGQFGGVPAAIIEPAVDHGGDGRGQHRLAPGDGVLAPPVGGLAATRLAGLQAGDVVGPIEALARILAVRPRLDPPAADIGVEGLRPHPQPRQGLRRGDPLAWSC